MAGEDDSPGRPKLAALGKLGPNGEMPASGDYKHLQFHPNTLTVETANSYKDQTAFGAATPVKQYTGGTTRTLSAQFFFDTSGSDQDVRDNTKCVMDMLDRGEGSPAPPICVFVYGAFLFVGVMESATQKFLMFNRDGKPVRATIDVKLGEYKSMSGESMTTLDEVKLQVVTKANDEELCHIADKIYGDPNMWRQVAKENKVANPRLVPEGTQLEASTKNTSAHV